MLNFVAKAFLFLRAGVAAVFLLVDIAFAASLSPDRVSTETDI